jgi:iron complex outermembrane receptor protein
LRTGEYPLDAFGLGRLVTRYQDPRHNMALLGWDQRNDEQLAFFGALDFDITEAVTAGLELRHDEEDRVRSNLLVPTVPDQKDTFSYDTWRANVNWDVTDSQMIYASAAKGVISGYFNATFDAAAQKPIPEQYWSYDPAENITYELGWKATWLEGRLTTELTAFYIDYTDIQISASIPPEEGLFFTNVIQNIGSATGQGFELAVDYRVNDNWSTGLTYSYAPTEFGDDTIDPGMSRYCGGNAGLIAGFCPSIVFNGRLQPLVEGEPLPRSPDTMASGYLSFDTEFGNGWQLNARADVSYTGEIPQYSLPFAYWASRTLMNARVGMSRGPLDVALWARNLTDEEYVSAGINQPGVTQPLTFTPNVSLGERRTWGVTVGYAFGGK